LIIDNKSEFPTIKEEKESACLKCLHCFAICPTGAITIWGKNPENSLLVSESIPAPAEMEQLVKTRRSIRKFKKQELDPKLIHALIETASYAPTAKNDNSVLFTVIDKKAEMDKLRVLVYTHLKTAFENQQVPESLLYFNDFQELWFNKQIDVLFRGAPYMLITSAPKTNTAPQVDSLIAMSYFELIANSNGIGTLWDGFAKFAFEKIAPEIKQIIGLPEDHIIGAVLVFGIPAVTYARAIQNTTINIKSVTM
jgi:nitroreductase